MIAARFSTDVVPLTSCASHVGLVNQCVRLQVDRKSVV